MSGESILYGKTWRVGRYNVTMTVPRVKPGSTACISMEWSPSLPDKMSAANWAKYTAGRDAALREIAELIGGKVALVEV